MGRRKKGKKNQGQDFKQMQWVRKEYESLRSRKTSWMKKQFCWVTENMISFPFGLVSFWKNTLPRILNCVIVYKKRKKKEKKKKKKKRIFSV